MSRAGNDSDTWRLLDVYQRLFHYYGPQGWWPGEGAFDVVVGAILTQSCAWTNVEKAIANLKLAKCWSLEAIKDLPEHRLASLIRPSGYFNTKARKIKAFAGYLTRYYDGNLSALLSRETASLRSELLSIHGIGPETADVILVYAAGYPSFVIDAYTRQILSRLGWVDVGEKEAYSLYQKWFHDRLPQQAQLFNEFHALLDRHAKDTCQKVPRCGQCCLLQVCSWGRERAL